MSSWIWGVSYPWGRPAIVVLSVSPLPEEASGDASTSGALMTLGTGSVTQCARLLQWGLSMIRRTVTNVSVPPEAARMPQVTS